MTPFKEIKTRHYHELGFEVVISSTHVDDYQLDIENWKENVYKSFVYSMCGYWEEYDTTVNTSEDGHVLKYKIVSGSIGGIISVYSNIESYLLVRNYNIRAWS